MIVWRSIRAWCNTSDDDEFYKYRIVSHVTTYATVIMRQRMMKTFSECWSCFERATTQWTLMFRHFDIFEISLCMFIFPFRISHLLFQPASFHLLYVVFWALFFSPPLLSPLLVPSDYLWTSSDLKWTRTRLAQCGSDRRRQKREEFKCSKQEAAQIPGPNSELSWRRSEWMKFDVGEKWMFCFLHFIQHLCLRSNID